MSQVKHPGKGGDVANQTKGIRLRTLGPNLEAFDAVRGSLTLRQFADTLGVDRSTVYRVWNGTTPPSARFIAQALTELPHSFNELFVVVDEAGKN